MEYQYPTMNMTDEDRAKLSKYQRPKYDPATGLVWIEDGSAGISVSAHPNVESNRETRRMFKSTRRMYAQPVESHGFIYDISQAVGSDKLSMLARKYCQCGGKH